MHGHTNQRPDLPAGRDGHVDDVTLGDTVEPPQGGRGGVGRHRPVAGGEHTRERGLRPRGGVRGVAEHPSVDGQEHASGDEGPPLLAGDAEGVELGDRHEAE